MKYVATMYLIEVAFFAFLVLLVRAIQTLLEVVR